MPTHRGAVNPTVFAVTIAQVAAPRIMPSSMIFPVMEASVPSAQAKDVPAGTSARSKLHSDSSKIGRTTANAA